MVWVRVMIILTLYWVHRTAPPGCPLGFGCRKLEVRSTGRSVEVWTDLHGGRRERRGGWFRGLGRFMSVTVGAVPPGQDRCPQVQGGMALPGLGRFLVMIALPRVYYIPRLAGRTRSFAGCQLTS
eukprot:Hpha_TRINITY_DN9443_c0_g1::TRINITY_DN9443_c0_g1_i2::g.139101::m.139101